MKGRFSSIHRFWFKLTNWEFWPFSVLYFPVNFYFIWLAIRCRSFFFFTASNPSIEFGGMLGEKKSEIFELIPKRYLPRHQLIPKGDEKAALATANSLGYPIIAKPDIGERGKLVEKLNTQEELINYVQKCPVDFLVQEYVELPVELAVFYVRTPDQTKGSISSLVQKEFMSVVGDGCMCVKSLLHKSARANLQMDFRHARFANLMNYVPVTGEKVIVESIGNHCRGTIFLDRSSLVDDDLVGVFDAIADEIPDFYFGRFDLRCSSIDELKSGKNFKILELNGAGAEPGHIYHPGSSIWAGYQSIFWHLNVLAQISRMNKRRGHAYWTFWRGMKKLQEIRRYNRITQNY